MTLMDILTGEKVQTLVFCINLLPGNFRSPRPQPCLFLLPQMSRQGVANDIEPAVFVKLHLYYFRGNCDSDLSPVVFLTWQKARTPIT
jgi:hypothetical protein